MFADGPQTDTSKGEKAESEIGCLCHNECPNSLEVEKQVVV